MHSEVYEFHSSIQPEEFINWLYTIEYVMEFKGIPDKMKVPLIAIRLRGITVVWW